MAFADAMVPNFSTGPRLCQYEVPEGTRRKFLVGSSRRFSNFSAARGLKSRRIHAGA